MKLRSMKSRGSGSNLRWSPSSRKLLARDLKTYINFHEPPPLRDSAYPHVPENPLPSGLARNSPFPTVPPQDQSTDQDPVDSSITHTKVKPAVDACSVPLKHNHHRKALRLA